MTDGAGSSQSFEDAPLTACNFAMPIQVGTRLAVNTCTGRDLIDGCGLPGREEVVIDFVPPTTGAYTVRAYDAGTSNVSVSTAPVNPGCGGIVASCQGVLGTTFTAGQHYYFVYEGMPATCAPIEVLID